MIEGEPDFDYVGRLPTEVLLFLFTFLAGRDLIRCRQVCARWKGVVEGMLGNEVLWRRHCKADFAAAYEVAKEKSKKGLDWFHTYRSLALWPRLKEAEEVRDEFACASSLFEEIANFQVLPDGIIALHQQAAIAYYDIETLEPADREPIKGTYLRFVDVDDSLLIHNTELHLYIVRRTGYQPAYEANVTLDQVKTFLLMGREVYYVNLENELYGCRLDDIKLRCQIIVRSEEAILALGNIGKLMYVLTFDRRIYVINGTRLILVSCLDDHANLLNELYKYNLFENMDWKLYFQWMCLLRRMIPSGPLQGIIAVRVYGDIVFVGCAWGVVRIYYKPFINGEFDIYNSEPLKQYNFMERSDCPVLSKCPIVQIDVLESENGHTVVIGMPKKIAVINFVHSFKKIASVAMLPYSDVKVLKKIDECT